MKYDRSYLAYKTKQGAALSVSESKMKSDYKMSYNAGIKSFTSGCMYKSFLSVSVDVFGERLTSKVSKFV